MMPEARIHYRVAAPDPAAHLFEVTLEVTDPDPAGQRFFMPAWIPGSYLVRDFARHVVRFEASCDGVALAVHKTDKSTWKVEHCESKLTVRYSVFAYDLSVRGAHLDLTHGYFNGVCVFVMAVGREQEPVSVELVRPDASEAAEWQVATTLATDNAQRWEFGRYFARDYDELIDHPVEMGCFDVVEFEAAGTPHAAVLCGRHRASGSRLSLDLTRICEEHVRLFGELPEMDRYLFLVRVLGEGYGGLEHRSSSSLMCRRDELPSDMKGMTKAYRRFLGLASHEYFHLWNIKRIKPAAFTPYRLGAESPTELLWVFEGITSYYDDLALVRSGAVDTENYLAILSESISRIYAAPGRHTQSLADASFDAWIKFYKPTANASNATVSYYAKGALIAMALDLTIRERSGGKKTLDDCMRAVWEAYGRTGIGMPEDGFEELASRESGVGLDDFFATYIRGTEDPDIDRLLERVGIRVAWCTPQDGVDVTLGLNFRKGSTVVASVVSGGPGERAGVAPGDQLVAIDGLKAIASKLDKAMRGYRSGEAIALHAFRGDELISFDTRLEKAADTRCKLTLDEKASERAVARRKAWLGGRG